MSNSAAAATNTPPSGEQPGERGQELPRIADTSAVSPADARTLSKLFFEQLRALDEETPEYAYARNTLIEMNMSLVHFAARRFNRPWDQEDVIQSGMIGLIKAIDRFDLSRETEFTSFAIPYIVGEIKRFFRDTTWSVHVPRRLQELRIELAQAREVLETRLNREPTVTELAERLGRPEDGIIEGLIAANGYSTDSLDLPSDKNDTHRTGTLADLVGEGDPGMELVENLISLAPMMTGLDKRQKQILRMRFGQDMTQAQIGRQLGYSQMHISRILNGTLAKLREGLLTEP